MELSKHKQSKVDFIYRNLEQVTTTIQKAKNGEWENHFEQQPPYGFSSIIYLAEINTCISLYDPDAFISLIKSLFKETVILAKDYYKIFPFNLKNEQTG